MTVEQELGNSYQKHKTFKQQHIMFTRQDIIPGERINNQQHIHLINRKKQITSKRKHRISKQKQIVAPIETYNCQTETCHPRLHTYNSRTEAHDVQTEAYIFK